MAYPGLRPAVDCSRLMMMKMMKGYCGRGSMLNTGIQPYMARQEDDPEETELTVSVLSYDVACDEIFALRHRKAVLWPRPKSSSTLTLI